MLLLENWLYKKLNPIIIIFTVFNFLTVLWSYELMVILGHECYLSIPVLQIKKFQEMQINANTVFLSSIKKNKQVPYTPTQSLSTIQHVVESVLKVIDAHTALKRTCLRKDVRFRFSSEKLFLLLIYVCAQNLPLELFLAIISLCMVQMLSFRPFCLNLSPKKIFFCACFFE